MSTDQCVQVAGPGPAGGYGVGVGDGRSLLDPDEGHGHSQLVGTHLGHLHTGTHGDERE